MVISHNLWQVILGVEERECNYFNVSVEGTFEK